MLPTEALVVEATTSWREANTAAGEGDWTRFGAAMQRLGESLELLERGPEGPAADDAAEPTPPE